MWTKECFEQSALGSWNSLPAIKPVELRHNLCAFISLENLLVLLRGEEIKIVNQNIAIFGSRPSFFKVVTFCLVLSTSIVISCAKRIKFYVKTVYQSCQNVLSIYVTTCGYGCSKHYVKRISGSRIYCKICNYTRFGLTSVLHEKVFLRALCTQIQLYRYRCILHRHVLQASLLHIGFQNQISVLLSLLDLAHFHLL